MTVVAMLCFETVRDGPWWYFWWEVRREWRLKRLKRPNSRLGRKVKPVIDQKEIQNDTSRVVPENNDIIINANTTNQNNSESEPTFTVSTVLTDENTNVNLSEARTLAFYEILLWNA